MHWIILAALAATAVSPQQRAVIETVKAQLKDPDSAQFKGVKETSPGYWCGWVNAKNGFGGYTGFQPFSDSGGKVEIVNDELLRLLERMEPNDETLRRIAPCRESMAK